MSWISGEYQDDEKPAPPGSLAPPPPEVRREMLKLEIAAQVANLQAEAGAMAAEAAMESGGAVDLAAVEAAAVDAVTDAAERVTAVDVAAGDADAGEASVLPDDAPAAGAEPTV
jgi:hypothetical protein